MPISYGAEAQQGFPYRTPGQPVTPSYTPAPGAEPNPANRNAWVLWQAQRLYAGAELNAGYTEAKAFSDAADMWEYLYGKTYGTGTSGTMTEYQRASLTQGAAQEQARLAWEQQQAGREEQRWAGEQEYNQQVTTAQARLSNLRAQLEAQVGIVPHMVSTEGEYMAGFGPGGMGERFGIPPVKPAYVDISGTVNQMQNVQMPQINWREYLGGQ